MGSAVGTLRTSRGTCTVRVCSLFRFCGAAVSRKHSNFRTHTIAAFAGTQLLPPHCCAVVPRRPPLDSAQLDPHLHSPLLCTPRPTTAYRLPAVLFSHSALVCSLPSLPHCPPRPSRSAHLTMIIPVRCFTCGKVVGNKWEQYINLLSADYSEMDALNALGLRRYCCRRMLLAHVDLIEKLLNYNSQPT